MTNKKVIELCEGVTLETTTKTIKAPCLKKYQELLIFKKYLEETLNDTQKRIKKIEEWAKN